MHDFRKAGAVAVSAMILFSMAGCSKKEEEKGKKNKKTEDNAAEDVEKDEDDGEETKPDAGKSDKDAKDADDKDDGAAGSNDTAGMTIKYGKFEQDGDTSNGPEDLEWIVLDENTNGDMLVITKDAIEGLPYHKIFQIEITWEECSLREWLNGDFYTGAFDADEQAKIAVTKVDNSGNKEFNVAGGNDTEDKIFLLSIDEATKYFDSDEKRICHPSAYAKNNGLEAGEKTVMEGNCRWWLRDPGQMNFDVARIFEDGSFNSRGGSADRENSNGVRPAMWIRQAPSDADKNWTPPKKDPSSFTTTSMKAMAETWTNAGCEIVPLTAEDLGADKQKFVEGAYAQKDGRIIKYFLQFIDKEAAREFVENVMSKEGSVTITDTSVGFMFEVEGVYMGGSSDFLGFMLYSPAQT